MNYKKVNLIWMVLLAAAAIVSSWFAYHTYEFEASKNLPNFSAPDAFIEEVEGWQMDKTGKLTFQFSSPRLTHLPKKDATLLLNPHFVIYQENKMPWHVDAEQGRATHGINTLYLWKNVNITEEKGPNNNLTTIQTQSVTVYPKKRIAKTNDDVEIQQPGGIVTAKGVQVDMEKGEAVLLSNAKGRYDPIIAKENKG